jgi:hypothetical protein
MGILDFIKNNDVNVNKVINDLSKGVDKLAFTKEEKATLNIKLADKLAGYTASTLNESTTRSKTRRVIAYLVIGSFLAMVFTYIVCVFIAPDKAELIKPVITSGVMVTAFIMVLAFFFGGYYAEKLNPKPKK